MRSLPARLYSALYAPAAPFIAAYLALRPDSRVRWRDYIGRNAFDGAPPAGGSVWTHAVSAGEVLSVAQLVRELRALLRGNPDSVLTTTIRDALDVAEKRAPGVYSSRTFLPLDLPATLGSLADRVAPRLMLLSETDFWPNLLLEMRRRRVPVYLVNGRISARAGEGYRMARALFAPALAAVRLFFVQRDEDCERLAAAGVPERRLRVRPSTKYERPGGPPSHGNLAADWLRRGGRRIVVAGSTHEGEEALLLEASRGLGGWVRVLAPRNPERAARVAALAPRALRWSARTGDRLPGEVDVVVVDTMGDLDAIYAAADLVVVGGSFGRWRGHNFLEPAWHGKPVLCGPDMADFAADASLFLRDGALLQVADASELRAAFSELAANPDAAREMGARARALAASGQGVSRKLAEEIAEDLARTKPERAVGEGLVASRAQAEPSHAPAPGAVFRGPASSLRVLVAVGSSGLGGGERHAVTLARELRDSGLADPTLACRGGGWLEAQARAAKLPIVTLPFLQGPDPFTVAGLARWLCVGGFDLLHTHLNWASFLGGLAAPLAGVPCVATVHGLSRAGYYRTAERLIAVSETVRRRLVRSLGDGQPIDLVYTGLPPIPAPDSRRLTALRDRLGLSAAEPVFTVIGKFHRNKNQRLLLEAARLLPASEAWRVMLVGAGPEEPALREVAALLGDRVAFAGEIDDVSTVLGASSLVVVPSLEEAFGLVALEAQMAGVPVAASRTGGLEELVEDGVSGRQFEPGDARGLASILGDYLSDPGSFVPLSRAARDASARFSPAAMARATCAVYEATLEQVRVR